MSFYDWFFGKRNDNKKDLEELEERVRKQDDEWEKHKNWIKSVDWEAIRTSLCKYNNTVCPVCQGTKFSMNDGVIEQRLSFQNKSVPQFFLSCDECRYMMSFALTGYHAREKE